MHQYILFFAPSTFFLFFSDQNHSSVPCTKTHKPPPLQSRQWLQHKWESQICSWQTAAAINWWKKSSQKAQNTFHSPSSAHSSDCWRKGAWEQPEQTCWNNNSAKRPKEGNQHGLTCPHGDIILVRRQRLITKGRSHWWVPKPSAGCPPREEAWPSTPAGRPGAAASSWHCCSTGGAAGSRGASEHPLHTSTPVRNTRSLHRQLTRKE